jgi:hypothetical protein
MAESSETKRNWEPKAPQNCGEESPAGRGFAFLHPFLETLDRAAQIIADVAKFLRAENQNDNPVPNAETTHDEGSYTRKREKCNDRIF